MYAWRTVDVITYGGKRCMANIPVRDNKIPTQNRPQKPPAAPYNRQVPYGQQSMPPRMQHGVPQQRPMQQPRSNYPAGNMRQSGYPARPMPPRAATEQLRPIKAQPSKSASGKKQKSKRQKKDYSKLKDFLLSFTISLVLFGIAAIIVCNALISLFT